MKVKSIKNRETHVNSLLSIAKDQDEMYTKHKPLYDAMFKDGMRVGHFYEPTPANLESGKSCASKASWKDVQAVAMSIFTDEQVEILTLSKKEYIEKHDISDMEYKNFIYPQKRGTLKDRKQNILKCFRSAMASREKTKSVNQEPDFCKKWSNLTAFFAENAPQTTVHKRCAELLQEGQNLLDEYYAGVADKKKSA
tara:strand:+ start:235 stop:822 length:588 start_codon:yes stop_codon:yes gene_type:complete